MKTKRIFVVVALLISMSFSFCMAVYAEDDSVTGKQEVTQGGVVLKNAEYPLDSYVGIADTGDSNIIKNSILDLGNTLFWLSKVIYQGFDIGIANLASADILNDQLEKVPDAANSLWQTITEHYVIIFILLVVIMFIYTFAVKGSVGEAVGMLFRMCGVFILATIWLSNSAYFVKSINNVSEEIQGYVLSVAGTFSEEVANVPSVEQVAGTTAMLRNTYFNAAVYRPYLIMNYGTTDEKLILQDDVGRIDSVLGVRQVSDYEDEDGSVDLKKKATDDLFEDIYGLNVNDANQKLSQIAEKEVKNLNNDYMDKGGSGVYAKLGIGMINIFLVILLGIPFLLLALVNLFVQILILGIVLLLPLSFAVSLIPRFSLSGVKLLLQLVGQFIYKAIITLFLIFALLVIQVVDGVFPPLGIGGYIINTVVLIILLNLMILKRNDIISMVTAGYINFDGNRGFQQAARGAQRATRGAGRAASGAAGKVGDKFREQRRETAQEEENKQRRASQYTGYQGPPGKRSKQRDLPSAAEANANKDNSVAGSAYTPKRSSQRDMPSDRPAEPSQSVRGYTARRSKRDMPTSAGRAEPSQNPRDYAPKRSSQRDMPSSESEKETETV